MGVPQDHRAAPSILPATCARRRSCGGGLARVFARLFSRGQPLGGTTFRNRPPPPRVDLAHPLSDRRRASYRLQPCPTPQRSALGQNLTIRPRGSGYVGGSLSTALVSSGAMEGDFVFVCLAPASWDIVTRRRREVAGDRRARPAAVGVRNRPK